MSHVAEETKSSQAILPINFTPNYNHIPCLDGLRAISVLLVMFSHFGFGNLIPGLFGVTVFFFISGFLITRLLLAEAQKNGTISIPNFYIRRFLRLSPALWFFLICAVGLHWLHGTTLIQVKSILPAVFYYANYNALFNSIYSVAQPATEFVNELPFGILWSLAVEEHFYMFFPLLLSFNLKHLKPFAQTIGIVIIAALIWRIVLVSQWHAYDYARWATDARIDSILFGCLLSIVVLYDSGITFVKKISTPKMFWTGMGLLMICFVVRDEFFRETLRFTLQGIALTLIFSGLLFTNLFPKIQSFLELPFLKWTGKISYSLYLWHVFCLQIVEWCLPTANMHLHNICAFILSFIIASASYLYIEKPVLKLRHRFSAPQNKPEPLPLT